MPFTIERLAGEPVHLVDLRAFRPAEDLDDLIHQLVAARAEFSGPFYEIMDASGVSLSFSELVLAIGQAMRSPRGGINEIPADLRRLVIVTTSDVIGLVMKGLEQAQYGGMPVAVTRTLDEALALVRQEAAGQLQPG